MQTPKQQETLTVKPGTAYLVIAVVFFAIALWFVWMAIHIEQFSNPAEYGAARLVYGVMGAIAFVPGLFFALFWKCRNVTFDADGVVVTRTFRSTRRYLWDSISAKVEQQHGLQYNVVISAQGKQVTKVNQAWDGYGQLLDLLIERDLLKENNLTKRGRTWASRNHMKLKDLARRKNPRSKE